MTSKLDDNGSAQNFEKRLASHVDYWKSERERRKDPFAFRILIRDDNGSKMDGVGMMDFQDPGSGTKVSYMAFGPDAAQAQIARLKSLITKNLPTINDIESERIAVGLIIHHEESHYFQNKFSEITNGNLGAKAAKDQKVIEFVSRNGLVDNSSAGCQVEFKGHDPRMKKSVPLEIIPASWIASETYADYAAVLKMQKFNYDRVEILGFAKALDDYRNTSSNSQQASKLKADRTSFEKMMASTDFDACKKKEFYLFVARYGTRNIEKTLSSTESLPKSGKEIDEFARNASLEETRKYLVDTAPLKGNSKLASKLAQSLKVGDVCQKHYAIEEDSTKYDIDNQQRILTIRSGSIPGATALKLATITPKEPTSSQPGALLNLDDLKRKLAAKIEKTNECVIPRNPKNFN